MSKMDKIIADSANASHRRLSEDEICERIKTAFGHDTLTEREQVIAYRSATMGAIQAIADAAAFARARYLEIRELAASKSPHPVTGEPLQFDGIVTAHSLSRALETLAAPLAEAVNVSPVEMSAIRDEARRNQPPRPGIALAAIAERYRANLAAAEGEAATAAKH